MDSNWLNREGAVRQAQLTEMSLTGCGGRKTKCRNGSVVPVPDIVNVEYLGAQLLVRTESDRIAYLERRQNEFLRLFEIQSHLFRSDFNLNDYLQVSVDRLKALIGADGVVVELVEGDQMVYRAIDAQNAQHLGLAIMRSGSLSGLCVALREILHCRDSETDPRVDREACRAVGARAMICAPIIENDRPIGVLKAFADRLDAFSQDDVQTLSLMADAVGAALIQGTAIQSRQHLLDERAEALSLLSKAKEVAEEHARRASMAEAIAGLGHWRYDIARQQSTWSPLMCDLHGAPRGAALPDEVVVEMIHPEDRALVGRHMRQGIQRELGTERITYRIRRLDGVERYVEASTAMEFNEAGMAVALVGVLSDVTERHTREAELSAARRAAESATRVKSEFLANMTHELRTPLTAVLGFSRLIDRQPGLPEETRLHLARVLSAGEALLHTINDILDFSKLEAGQVEMRPHPVDIRQLVHQTVDLLAVHAVEKRLDLKAEVEDDVPLMVLIDPGRIRQILLNLVGNAVKFTDAGGVCVTLSRAQSPDGLDFSIIDSGPGISAEQRSQLFRRFAQVDGGQAMAQVGTGLGLAICKGLVEAMGGQIGVESQVGQGSRFWFTVQAPVAEAAAAASAVEDVALVAGRRVLVVDDNQANRVLVRSILSTFGASVAEAEDGLQAVALATQGNFDLVLMDLRMPGLDGVGAARLIRSEGQEAEDLPILAFSADREVDLYGGLFQGVVGKPLDPEALLRAVATGCRA